MRLKPIHKTLLHALVIAGGVLMLYPLLWMVASSFKVQTVIFSDPGLLPRPEHFTLDHYTAGWRGVSGVSFSTFYQNTFLLVLLSIIGTIVSSSMAAYAFARLQFILKRILFAVMLVTMMLPFHVVIIPQYIMFNRLGWLDSYLPLLVPKFLAVEGFFIFLIVQFIRGLPRELDQAATVDGCGPVQIYWRLIMPLALPALVTTTIFTFIWTWNDFFGPLLYLSDIRKFTVSLGLRAFVDSTGESAWGALFAMSTVSLVPIFLLFILLQRFLIEGITSGGIKG